MPRQSRRSRCCRLLPGDFQKCNPGRCFGGRPFFFGSTGVSGLGRPTLTTWSCVVSSFLLDDVLLQLDLLWDCGLLPDRLRAFIGLLFRSHSLDFGCFNFVNSLLLGLDISFAKRQTWIIGRWYNSSLPFLPWAGNSATAHWTLTFRLRRVLSQVSWRLASWCLFRPFILSFLLIRLRTLLFASSWSPLCGNLCRFLSLWLFRSATKACNHCTQRRLPATNSSNNWSCRPFPLRYYRWSLRSLFILSSKQDSFIGFSIALLPITDSIVNNDLNLLSDLLLLLGCLNSC